MSPTPARSVSLTFLCVLLAVASGVLRPIGATAAVPTSASTRKPTFTASERSLWSLQPIRRPSVPASKSLERVRTPIDGFVLNKLEERGLGYSPPAAPRELIRRATFDLVGLPPTPAEVDTFVADTGPDAYGRLVERLLASPHYGETWGRNWLDLVRYAETAGYNADPIRPLAWKYRDFVIRAFNSDLPYDRFVAEQIAGDELFPDDPQAWIATGYERMWPDESNASVVALARQDALNDLTANVGAVFLGLSIGCAQCHDHKFDPIRQHDFYRLQAFFSGIVPVDRADVGTPAELADYRRRLDRWLAETAGPREELHRILSTARAKAAAVRRMRFPPDVLAAIDKPSEKRTALERQLFFWSDRQITVNEKELKRQISPRDHERLSALRKQMAELEAGRPSPPDEVAALAAVEIAGPLPPTHLLAGGSYNKPLRELQPGFLSVLYQETEPRATVTAPRAGTSGRRSALARWLTDRRNPLVARVIVNRVWQGHFGHGLVQNANDFGTQTPPPTHPELLDWLADRFVADGWSIKSLHRLIMTSNVYRQSSARRQSDQQTAAAAPTNGGSLYQSYPRRRLSAEQIRDAVLALSGRLNPRMEGPSVRPPLPASYPKLDSWIVTKDPVERDRRSIYIFAKRNLPYPLLKAFDLPDMHESCARRSTTTIAPQALAMINNEFVVNCGDSLASRIIESGPAGDWRSHIADAYRATFGRPPAEEEIREGLTFLRVQAEHIPPERELLADDGAAAPDDHASRTAFADLCHTLLNTNEFLFIE